MLCYTAVHMLHVHMTASCHSHHVAVYRVTYVVFNWNPCNPVAISVIPCICRPGLCFCAYVLTRFKITCRYRAAHCPSPSSTDGEAANPGPPRRRDPGREHAIDAGFFIEAKTKDKNGKLTFGGSLSGYVFKFGTLGLGYYRDGPNADNTPTTIALADFIPPPFSIFGCAWDTSEFDGFVDHRLFGQVRRRKHFSQILSVNANCWNTLVGLLEDDPGE